MFSTLFKCMVVFLVLVSVSGVRADGIAIQCRVLISEAGLIGRDLDVVEDVRIDISTVSGDIYIYGRGANLSFDLQVRPSSQLGGNRFIENMSDENIWRISEVVRRNEMEIRKYVNIDRNAGNFYYESVVLGKRTAILNVKASGVCLKIDQNQRRF